MKKTPGRPEIFFLLAAFIFSCSGTSRISRQRGPDAEQKACNTFVNTSIIVTGTFLVAFGNHCRLEKEAFTPYFTEELNKKTLKDLDEKIETLNVDAFNSLDTLYMQMSALLKLTSMTDPDLYHQLFLSDVMQQGVAITEKYPLPYGFRPFSQNLTLTEIKRYIVYFIAAGIEGESPMNKTLQDLAAWMQEDKFLNAPFVQEFMSRITE
ncbi:MAG: hypothetical protein JW801_01875 [Bacteroidales bacterium]|nr:hypothetical protein [Bacteroidales bacterium]